VDQGKREDERKTINCALSQHQAQDWQRESRQAEAIGREGCVRMPSSNIRDDLPNHSVKAGILWQLAQAVLRGGGYLRGAGRRAAHPRADATPGPEIVDAVVVDEPHQQLYKALPDTHLRSTADAYAEAQKARERVRAKRSRR
jgi:hypothetical protein